MNKEELIKIINSIDLDLEKISLDDFSKEFKEIQLDSLDFYSLISKIEEEKNIKIPDKDIEKINSLDDLIEYLNK